MARSSSKVSGTLAIAAELTKDHQAAEDREAAANLQAADVRP